MVVSPVPDRNGLRPYHDASGIRQKFPERLLRQRMKKLFEMVGKPPIVVVQDGEILARDRVQARPEGGAAISTGTIHNMERIDARVARIQHRPEIQIVMAHEDHFEAAVDLLGDGGDSALNIADRTGATA